VEYLRTWVNADSRYRSGFIGNGLRATSGGIVLGNQCKNGGGVGFALVGNSR